MKRFTCYLLLLLSLGASTSPIRAGHPIRKWFVEMPDSMMPLLTHNNKLDFIDFKDCGMEAVVTNRLDGKSRLEVLTDSYLCLNYTASTDVSMRLLPINDTTDILCVVTTAKATIQNSHIRFYDAQWQLLDATDYVSEPTWADFCTGEGEAIGQRIGFNSRTFRLSPDTLLMECRWTAIDYMTKEDRQSISPYLERETISYMWTDGKFLKR